MEHRKSLTTVGVFSLGAGAMISSGLFILPSLAFTEAGIGVIPAYFIAGLCMLPAVFTKLELSSAIPKAGGSFFYLARIFGAPVGVVSGFADWFSVALKSAFALVGIGVFGTLLFPGFGQTEFKGIAVAACLVFTALNLLSVEGTSRFQTAMVIFLLTILAAYVLVGYRKMDFTHFGTGRPFDVFNIITTTGMVFISYGGITKIVAAVEEIKNPEKMLVPGLLGAFFVVQTLYLLVVFVTVGAMDGERLAASFTPLTDAAHAFFASSTLQNTAVALVAAAGLLAFFTTANAGILSASRIPFAMSRDGMLPQSFGRLSGKGTPVVSILVTSAFMMIIILGLNVKDLAKVASLFLMLVFLLENLGLLVMRASRLAAYKPTFRSPLFPFLQIAGVLIYIVLIISQGLLPILIAVFIVLISLVWYVVYARRGWSKTSAFVRVLKRVSGEDLAESGRDLEDELLSILMERENIKEDRFDALVRDALVLDYSGTMTRQAVFHDITAAFAGRHGLDAAALEKKFQERENQTSTLIFPGVAVPHAIPHVVVDGESIFDLILVRARYGIQWTGDDVVYTAFCMIGSRDERNFHLRALMSIAQTLQDPAFTKAWMEARSERELRTALILSRRKRHEEGL